MDPIWEEVAKAKGRAEGMATPNQELLWGITSYRRVFRGRSNFSASLPLLVFVRNVLSMNLYLDPDCSRGEFIPCVTRQGVVEVFI